MNKNTIEMRFHSFGTMKTFERRKRAYVRLRNIITYLGFIVPFVIGCVVLSFQINNELFKNIIIPIASIIIIFQMSVSLWSAIAGWDSKLEYAINSIKSNNNIFLRVNGIINNNSQLSKNEQEKLDNLYNSQDAEDAAHGLSMRELRYGYRCSLIKFNQTCPTCNNKPTQMKPSKCDTCGNFPRRYNW